YEFASTMFAFSLSYETNTFRLFKGGVFTAITAEPGDLNKNIDAHHTKIREAYVKFLMQLRDYYSKKPSLFALDRLIKDSRKRNSLLDGATLMDYRSNAERHYSNYVATIDRWLPKLREARLMNGVNFQGALMYPTGGKSVLFPDGTDSVGKMDTGIRLHPG